eukprot:gnl/TRDRNA2_/TRDRNA2_185372_c0_seq1.p1 gnl/TRDRNA2_/TRDRNA2_185372_c0~~gnl/TRDRNA2_/TRDRNA2_185372_c0_seq1.p1  ORF type:complete len:208 (-),score=53.34 gnl/TRDRNA2_/TRDRNA2_185372_c0_seq1:55-678(-)
MAEGPIYQGMYGARFGAQLSPQEEEIITVAFDAFKEKVTKKLPDGTTEEVDVITADSLMDAFNAIGAGADIHDIQLLIEDKFDEDGDGSVDEQEFWRIMTRKFLGEDDDDSFVHAFEMMDSNKDGYIPLVELRHVLMRQGKSPLSEQEVDELMIFADLDGDGLIDYRSFLRWLASPESFVKNERKAAANPNNASMVPASNPNPVGTP